MTVDQEGDRERDQNRDRDRDRERDRDRDRDRDREREAALLKIIEKWLPIVTVVVGAIWALYTYQDHQKEVELEATRQAEYAQEARNFEARKPFLEKQLGLYVEASKVAGYLVTHKPNEAEWATNYTRLQAMYWSELSMVESPVVEDAMVKLAEALSSYSKEPLANEAASESKRVHASNAAYTLAHAIRKDLDSIWQKNN